MYEFRLLAWVKACINWQVSMAVVRIFFFLAVLRLKAVAPLPLPAAMAVEEEAPTELVEVEVEGDAEDESPLGDTVLAQTSPPDLIELVGFHVGRDADGPDEPPPALADRPPNA